MTDEAPEQLMNALISKMETMDADIQSIRAENLILKNTLDNPQVILRKAGFVSYGTPLSEDVEAGVFRGDLNTTEMDFVLKEDDKLRL